MSHKCLPIASIPKLVAFALTAASTAAMADVSVPYNSTLIPPGLRPGNSFHLTFVTSTSHNRLSEPTTHPANINYFNGLVNTTADASTIPGIAGLNWFAIVSTRSAGASPVVVNARDNAVVSAPVYRLDDALVASGFSDMWDSILNVPISINQNGGSASTSVWTGCAAYTGDGLADGIYTLGGGTNALVGSTGTNLGTWLANGSHTSAGTGSSLPFYALSERITIAIPADVDGDGLPDWFELANTSPSSDTSFLPGDDTDLDGLTNLQEYELFTTLIPTDPDTDGDGLLDGANATVGNADPRYTALAAAGILYTENAGLRTFRGEATVSTNPTIVDTDGDTLSDGVESNTGIWLSAADRGTNPLDKDTDDDSLQDQVETNTGTQVSKTNTGTHPLLADTDNDGAGDWYEITASFTNPSLSSSKPNVPYPLPDPNSTPTATNKPVKVFILSGQSNMVGIGYGSGTGFKPGSLEYITKTEKKFPNLIDGSGNFTSRQDVWYEGVVTATAKKQLSIGCGNSSTNIGPELGFGHVMGWYLDEPVIIIKASQGNRSLAWDILPPTSPSHNYTDGKTYAGYGQSPNSWTTVGGAPSPFVWYAGKQYDDFFKHEADMGAAAWATGIAYPANCQIKHNGWTYISSSAHTSGPTNAPQVNGSGNPIASTNWNVYSIDNVADVLDNFSTRFASQGWAAQGFEIAGFAWFQGFGDQSEPNATKYEENLTRLINQTRSYYANRYPGKVSAQAPFAVATIGFGGQPFSAGSPSFKVHAAQLAVGNPAIHPEFTNNVKSVDTLPFWRELNESPGTQGYHYNNNAETYTLVGDALGRLMVDMIQASNGPDVTPPSILTYSPVDNAIAVPVGSNLVATFNEVITLGTGDITIKNLTDATEAVIAVTDSLQVSSSGNTLTINPTSALLSGKNYAIQIASTAINDFTGNPFSGISNDTTWNFSTPIPDLTAPSVSTLNPADGATNVALAANLVATFSESIAIGTGDITLKNITDSTETVIAVTSVAQVSVSGSILTINPTANLLPGKQYAIRLAAGSIKDLSDNPFVGIADDTTWDFTTVPPDLTAPTILSFSPVDNATDVALAPNLVVTFSEPIALNTGDIVLRNLTDATETTISATDAAQVSATGSALTINPVTDLIPAKNYAIRIGLGAVQDLGGNSFIGIEDDTTWNFTSAVVPFVWTQTAGNAQAWTTGTNWQGGNVPAPIVGDTVDLSTANLVAAITLTLGADRTATIWKFGDATTASHDWIVSAGNSIILAGTTPTINVVNRTATLNNIVDGSAGLTKTGGGTLALGNTANTYSGGTTINGGNLTIAADLSLGATNGTFTLNPVTVNANASINIPNSNFTFNRPFILNNGASLITNVTSAVVTVNGAVTGTGSIAPFNQSNAALTLANTANTFTGNIQLAAGIQQGTLIVNSIGDGGIVFLGTQASSGSNYGQANFRYGSGATDPLVLSTRQFQLGTAGGGKGVIQNDNTAESHANTITINTHLLAPNTGARTLELAGANTGANTFAGNITNGAGTVTLQKAGAGKWVLSGTNTYTGPTVNGFNNPAGAGLFFQGIQSLPPGTTLSQTHTGGVGGHGAFRILDDSATPASRSGVNIAMTSSNTSNGLSLFVGNNGTGNGGNGTGGTTGSTIELGNLNFTQSVAGNTSQTLNLTGANSYRLQINHVNLPGLAASSTTWNGTLNPTSAPLTVAGNIRQAAGNAAGVITLTLDGTASGNLVSGNITDSLDTAPKPLKLTKANSSTWTLTGTSTYTGITTLSGGVLELSGSGTLGAGNYAANIAIASTSGGTLRINSTAAQTLGGILSGAGALHKNNIGTLTLTGSNTYTGTTTHSAGKLLVHGNQSTATGAISVATDATLGGTGTLGGSTTIAAGGKLEFNLSTAAASHDKLELAATRTLTFSGASTLTLTSSGGSLPGDYTLVTAPGGFGSSVAPASVILPPGWLADTPRFVGPDLKINITSTGTTASPYETWAVGGVAFDTDTNNDGVDNGLAWLLGAANPSENALGKLPSASRNGANLRLTFRCLKSTSRGGVALKVQSSNDLGTSDPWTNHEAAVPDADATVNGVIFDTTDDGAFINVIADIPNAGVKSFARLKAESAP